MFFCPRPLRKGAQPGLEHIDHGVLAINYTGTTLQVTMQDCYVDMAFQMCFSVNVLITLPTPLSYFNTDGYLPDSWKYATVTPIHKKGPTSDPNNFRPVSLTATCCRVMERVINNQLLHYLLDHHLISRKQHGFIKCKSVCINLLECLDDWTLNLQTRCVTDVIHFDFRKAFDTVCHNKLLSKSNSYGICGNLLSWIEAFLCGRSQSVRIDEAISTPIPVSVPVVFLKEVYWVRHCFYFLLYINDVGDIFDDLRVSLSLFADYLNFLPFINLMHHTTISKLQ